MSNAPSVDEVTQLRAEIEMLKEQVATLTATLKADRTHGGAGESRKDTTPHRTDRRGLLKVAGAASIGALGAGLLMSEPVAAVEASFSGLYRGTCINNEDPQQVGRILVSIPSVFGFDVNEWALPSFPVGSSRVPATNEGVWIAFEGGNPRYPVWIGVPDQTVSILSN